MGEGFHGTAPDKAVREGFSYIQKIEMTCSIMLNRNMQSLCHLLSGRICWGSGQLCCGVRGQCVDPLLPGEQYI
ncbi:hypothetical protein KMS84_39920, partial [Streptomyces sp. IBSBF 2807]|nr:hypothetical protein [Streptomyces hilarionis]